MNGRSRQQLGVVRGSVRFREQVGCTLNVCTTSRADGAEKPQEGSEESRVARPLFPIARSLGFATGKSGAAGGEVLEGTTAC